MNTSKSIQLQQLVALGRELLPIGDAIFGYMKQLSQSNFNAFLPRHNFIESFAENTKDLDTHRKYLKEIAKLHIAIPDILHFPTIDREAIYSSDFLKDLIAKQNDINRVPLEKLRSRYDGREATWRREIDPCKRAEIRLRVEQSEAWTAQWTAMKMRERQALIEEAPLHTTELTDLFPFNDEEGRHGFFQAAMDRDAKILGFYYDEEKSRNKYAVFSKKMVGDWDLCWAIEDSKSFFFNLNEGRFHLHLELRNQCARGRLSKKHSGYWLHLKHAYIVPGFANGYGTYYDLPTLETSIKAHLFLYSLIAPSIEKGIQRALKG